jgi:hypothetical protein
MSHSIVVNDLCLAWPDGAVLFDGLDLAVGPGLDLASVRQLSEALAAYRGALIVASHDLPFLHAIGITRWLRLDGRLAETEPP